MNYQIKHLACQKKLATLVEQKLAVTVCRDTTPFENQVSGYLMDYSNELLMVAHYSDFLPDGFKILQMKDVTDYQCSQEDQFSETVMRGEGVVPDPPSFKVDLLSWSSALESLMVAGEEVVVENERSELFAVGRILSVNGDMFSLAPRDGVGRWVRMRLDIAWNDITSVSFGCRYAKGLCKYGKKVEDMPDWDNLPENGFDDEGEDDE